MIVYLGWGANFLALQYALYAFPVFLMNGSRNLLGGIILYVFQRLRGSERPTPEMWKSAFVVGFIMISCGAGPNVWAQSVVPSGVASLIIGSVPLWVVILEIINSKRNKTSGPNLLSIVGVCIGFAGIIFLIRPGMIMGINIELHTFGAITLICGSFFWALGSIKARKALLPPSRILGSGMMMICGGVTLVIVGILKGESAQLSFENVTIHAVMGYLYTLLIASAFTFAVYSWLLTVAPVTLVSTFAFVSPIVAVILGIIVLDEVFTMRHFVASLMILAAVALVIVASGLKPKVKPKKE